MPRLMGTQRSGSANFMLLAAMLLCTTTSSARFAAGGTVVSVGGNEGWKVGKGYGRLTMKRGDSLVFSYPKGMHNVLQVSAADYKSCDTSKPVKVYRSGKDSVRMSKSGNYYFICGLKSHCTLGMKLSVIVK